jgi:ornithine carbamoyltransferase
MELKPLFKGKHFITLQEWTKPEIDKLLEVSFYLKDSFITIFPRIACGTKPHF